MLNHPTSTTDILLVAVPETAGSTLYGMLDVFLAAGRFWESVVGEGDEQHLIKPWIVATSKDVFRCGNGIPVEPDFGIADAPASPVIVVPDLWIRPDEVFAGRHSELIAWMQGRFRQGASIYSACTGAIVLAETGLLDGKDATSHWGYAEYFRHNYPRVRFDPAPNLCFGDSSGRIVTAGGVSSWHDLALHVIARYCGPTVARQIAKVFLMKWHEEGDLPFTGLVRYPQHADAKVRACQDWLKEHFVEPQLVTKAVAQSGLPERTFKRRFKTATGTSLTDHIQNLRIEEAKRRLETSADTFDDIAAAVGYENPGFCRRLFKRRTGLTPDRYRRLFQAIGGTLAAEQRAETA